MLAAGGLLALSHGISILPSIPAGRRRWEREEAPLLHRIRACSGRFRHKADAGQTAYGSEGWGFESLRARSVETDDLAPRTAETLSGAFVVLNRESPNLTM